MKAIKITQQLKNTNTDLFGNIEIGFNRQFSIIPTSFYSLNYNAGQRTDGYHLLSDEIHKQDGFFDLIIPELNDNQKLGEIYFDEENQVFTYKKSDIPPPTMEEILVKETEKYIQRSRDGQNYYAKLSAEFRLAKVSGVITEQEYHEIEKLLIPTRNEVLAGQWISAKNELESLGAVQIGQSLYDRLHLLLSTYINENY